MIQFTRCMVTIQDGTSVTGLQELTDTKYPKPTPINVKRFTRTGTATKVTGPTMSKDNTTGYIDYGSFRVPLGMEGFTIKIQAGLSVKEGASKDPIATWATIQTGDILQVLSNCCDELGRVDTTGRYAPFIFMEDTTTWYVDAITIKAIKASPTKADMELTLIRMW